MSLYGHLVTYYLVAFIPNKFPTLLAEREIIANAVFNKIQRAPPLR